MAEKTFSKIEFNIKIIKVKGKKTLKRGFSQLNNLYLECFQTESGGNLEHEINTSVHSFKHHNF